MQNVQTSVKGDVLTITIDISKQAVENAPLSSTGKTKLVASTGGALPIACSHGKLSLAVNVMAK